MQRDVFILEDHPATLQQLVHAVQRDDRLELAGCARSLAAAKRWFELNTMPAAVLLDLGLPDGNGSDLIGPLTSAPDPPLILVMTVFGDEKHVIKCIEAGASGYLLKEREPRHIADAICQVLGGDSPISPSIARHLLNRFRTQDQTPSEPPVPDILSPREVEVLQLVVKGFTYREIAENMELSVHTVTSHIQHIYRKLAVNSRGEAVFEAIQLGIVDVKLP